jgi:LmbE family N-acetylglucosaminyl deacetylase
MAIYAHPDDADLSCGGSLALWAAGGAEIEVVICCSGDKGSSDSETDPAALVAERAEEAQAAAELIGAGGLRRLGHPDGEVSNDHELRTELVGAIRRFMPETVVCPDPRAVFFGELYYNHRDHREVGYAALDAVVAARSPLYYPGEGPAHQVQSVLMSGTLEPSVWIDISSTVHRKADAVACHRSQLGETTEWLRAALEERAEETGRQAGVSHAESFRRLLLE